MLTLALSTSSSQGSVCLGRGASILKLECWQKQTSHSEKITLELQKILEESQVRLEQIQLIVCSQGPGSFTGLRVGLSVARSLSHSLQVPIVALNDGLCVALNAQDDETMPRLVISDAQKNKIFASIYQKDSSELKELLAPCLLSVEELSSLLTADRYLLMGEGSNFLRHFPDSIQKKLILDTRLATTPLANKMLIYVHQNFSNLKKLSWEQLLPLYLRASAAEEVAAEKISKNK